MPRGGQAILWVLSGPRNRNPTLPDFRQTMPAVYNGVGVTGPRDSYYIPPTPLVSNKAQSVCPLCRGEGHEFLSSHLKLKRSTGVISLQEANSLGQPYGRNEQTHKKLNDRTKTEKEWIGFLD